MLCLHKQCFLFSNSGVAKEGWSKDATVLVVWVAVVGKVLEIPVVHSDEVIPSEPCHWVIEPRREPVREVLAAESG